MHVSPCGYSAPALISGVALWPHIALAIFSVACITGELEEEEEEEEEEEAVFTRENRGGSAQHWRRRLSLLVL